jgi:hypothetical protein
MLSEAASKAFPISLKAEIRSALQNADYLSNLPSNVFEAHKTGTHAFGLFNSREIADCIFVNCPKTDYIKQIQVSGTGELEIFISEDYMKAVVNGIIDKQSLEFENTVIRKANDFLIEDLSSSNGLGINCIRGMMMINSLKKIYGIQKQESKSYALCFDYSGNKEIIPKIMQTAQRTNGEFTEQNIKDWITDEILLKIDSSASLIFTSDLSNDFSNTNQINSSKLDQQFVRVKQIIINWLNSSNNTHLNYLFRTHQTQLVSTFLSTHLADLPRSHNKEIVNSAYGDVFFPLDLVGANELFATILNKIESSISVKLPACYDIHYITLSALKYFILRNHRSRTLLIIPSDLLAKTSKSLWAVLAVEKYLSVPSETVPFDKTDIQAARTIIAHLMTMPDAIEDCLVEASPHFLLLWLERLCELYIRADYAIPATTRPKLDTVMKTVIKCALGLAGIDINKIYSH